ncbi:MAG TPA: alpha-amylase family glycosyl hydrolase [Pseudonocardiaceae bacterium]|nr:alpha-amylase family glycosyl hydrolase [Pseudonocardiaceae bacterium]
MPSSLLAPEFEAVLAQARQARGQPGGPFPSPQDWRDQWIYFLMVDRFDNPAIAPRHMPFDDPDYDAFQGGSFSGIRAQLPYLQELGVGAIWLSPVLKNLPFEATYHGYGIHDFLRAEPRFANDPQQADNELRALVDSAHAAGIYVIFDIVLNHTGNVFAYPCQAGDTLCQRTHGAETAFHADVQQVGWRGTDGTLDVNLTPIENIPNPSLDAYVWPQELQRNRFFRRQGDPPDGGDDTIGDFASLKQMLTADTDLQQALIQAYQYVIARYDIDGFRIDTLRYLKGDLPRLFGNAIREFALDIGKENFFTFGEVFDQQAEQDIARFIGRNTNDASELVGVDAALDYPLFSTLKPVVKGLAAPATVVRTFQLRKEIERNILSSHGDATRFFVTFLDNHDVKERIRFIQHDDEHRFDDQVTLGLACLNCLPGIPCLYYGTEQGLHGRGSDPAVREALWGGPGFDRASPFYQAIQAILRVRANRMALRYGRYYFRPVSGDGQHFGISVFQPGALAFSRILASEEVLVVANTDPNHNQALDVIVDAGLNRVDTQYQILYSNKAIPTLPSSVNQINTVSVDEVDGTTGHGPVRTVHVVLQPMEVQILSR